MALNKDQILAELTDRIDYYLALRTQQPEQAPFIVIKEKVLETQRANLLNNYINLTDADLQAAQDVLDQDKGTDITGAPLSNHTNSGWMVGAALVLLLGYGLFYYLKHNRKNG